MKHWSPSWIFTGFFLFWMLEAQPLKAAFPVRPEIQWYYTLGTHGTSYSTLAGGLAIDLSSQVIGPNRRLQVLGVYVPESLAGARGKAASWNFHASGQGLELALSDQLTRQGTIRHAKIALRHLDWEQVESGQKSGKLSSDTLHFGWSGGERLQGMVGIDLAMLHTPEENLLEVQGMLGMRFDF